VLLVLGTVQRARKIHGDRYVVRVDTIYNSLDVSKDVQVFHAASVRHAGTCVSVFEK
jgi:hypothetical protein